MINRHSDKRVLSLLLERVRPHWRRMAGAMAMMLVVGATTGLLAYMMEPMLNEIFLNKNRGALRWIPLSIVLIFALKGLCSWGQVYTMQWVGLKVVTGYRIDLYAHLQRLSLSYYDQTPTGELISRLTNDVNQIQGSVTNVVTGVIRDFFSIIALLFVLFYQDWFLAIFAVLVFPLCAIPLVKFGRRLRRISNRSQETMADVSVQLHETITGARIVKGFCREGYEGERFAEKAWLLFSLRMKDVMVRAVSSPLMEFLGGLAIASIIFYGGSQVLDGTSTPGAFFSFLSALILLYEPVKRLSGMNNEIQLGLTSLHRVYKILDTRVEVDDRPGARELAPLKKGIHFLRVSFAYRKGAPVIKGVDIKIPKGQVLALVGSSGAGKTTLVNLLPRFYEVSGGAVTIDGLDIREATLKSLRSQIAIVTQQTILFNDTIQANISYGRPGASEEEIVAAADAAYALDFIKALPHRFDTMIGESGVFLSGGERQRLSIARALLSDRPILILDEATSNLDTESELFVQKALENLMRGRTTFVIAHRLSTVQRADRILVMDQGCIVEDGRHQELMAGGGQYHRLYTMQFAVDRGLEAPGDG